MPVDVIMPALGMAQDTGKVLRWLKQDGASVVKGEPLLEVETDKVTVEIEAPANGTLAGLAVPEGAEVPVGSVIAFVLVDGEQGAAAPAPPRRPLASPKARRLAEARGVDLAAVAGSGPGGAVVAGDIAAGGPEPAPAVGSVWRVMAERMTRAWQEIPQFVLTRDVDARRLLHRHEGVSVTDLLVEASARALARHPRLTASWHDGGLVAGTGVDVGVAVATADALVVPVIHGADRLTLADISARRRQLAEAARAGTLRPEDVQGGTFTISNLGMYGVDAFQAIVNPPQAAILAVGRIVERPVAIDGALAARPVLTLTLSFDHRVVDGARGAEFLDTLASLVEAGEEG
ncbi:MAG TPA: dihydrolipoamide acetyltransferase family protein [Gaiellaceae bacterium]|nr:dihydrolipoamide acetyltransferase family protein [Gaiellaceae bacterium]